jgi:hypothetical protein
MESADSTFVPSLREDDEPNGGEDLENSEVAVAEKAPPNLV